MEELYRRLLSEVGENPEREGLLKTPSRAAAAMRQLTQGYRQDLEQAVNGAVYDENIKDMILVRDIDFFSVCEHHLLPFFGKCHVAYVPNGKILGLSKVARVVEVFSRRLQIQERLSNQIADAVDKVLKPMGVAVVMEAQHLCMLMRGVEKQNSVAVTSAMLGVFRANQKTRMEFLDLVHKRS